MPTPALNPGLIRVVLIALFVVITQILRAAKMSKTAKPVAQSGQDTGNRLGDVLREAMRQRAEQTRARQSGESSQESTGVEPLEFDKPFQQPSKIEPESAYVSSLLLLALPACLCLMVYRYWAG